MKLASLQSLPKLALATSLATSLGSAAHATIITTLNTPVTLAAPTNGTGSDVLQFNVATGDYGFGTAGIVNPQFQLSYPGNANASKPQLQGLSTSPTSQVLYFTGNDNVDYVKRLAGFPATVDTQPRFIPVDGTYGNGVNHQPYLSYNSNQSQFSPDGTIGYVAFHLADPNTPGQIDFGVASLSYNTDYSLTLRQLAYDNRGIAPEPSTLATSLVALGGATGCALARRRRLAKVRAA